MDGEQAGLSQSLQFRLARAISLAVAAMATVAGILSFRATLHEVHEFQDEILEQAAELLGPESGQATASLPVQGCLQTDDDEEGLIIQRLPALPKDGQDRKDRKQSSITDTITKDSRAMMEQQNLPDHRMRHVHRTQNVLPLRVTRMKMTMTTRPAACRCRRR